MINIFLKTFDFILDKCNFFFPFNFCILLIVYNPGHLFSNIFKIFIKVFLKFNKCLFINFLTHNFIKLWNTQFHILIVFLILLYYLFTLIYFSNHHIFKVINILKVDKSLRKFLHFIMFIISYKIFNGLFKWWNFLIEMILLLLILFLIFSCKLYLFSINLI